MDPLAQADLEFSLVDPGQDARSRAELEALLGANDLRLEADVPLFVAGRIGPRLVACAGLAEGVVKCVAIDSACRGERLALKLMDELMAVAMERGQSHLFLYTRCGCAALFEGCGFHRLVEVPGHAVLLENTPVGIRWYCDRLRALRHEGRRIGSVVLNANPFTLGHLHLARQARAQCDWLHVFVVGEDASRISYVDRLDLVRKGLAGLDRITVHEGSPYLISRATFPGYFIKDACVVDACATAMDLLLFRTYLAPALGITHRYVGDEPFCELTRRYNADMRTWLEGDFNGLPPVQAVELPRLEVAGGPVSASGVRRLLDQGAFDRMAPLVPASTLACLRARYAPRHQDSPA